ncbi:prohormone-3 [Fopius arisanus]|uniref:PROH3_0 protein n=1 Tax=Fopius arisanus TaxID=64838 RepID=A0A0C9QE28_9HYME|nr:PREDICTED: prohormone-3 [Fopius arisanus]XP_011296821.1 PREDICTED: prohormone-3 [Fopius arisanus]XP_011296822.1 PREDICTED: prohormone-3 [Fopius arisanus]
MGKSCFICAIVVAVILAMNGGADAWGGLFNRFTPEMLSNLGYGGQGGYKPSYLQRPLVGHYGNDFGEGLQFAGDDDPCDHRPCGSNEHCCPGQICMNVAGGPEGTCFYAWGLKQGELCARDNDCETGLMCADVAGGDTRSCQPPVTSNKQYSEECLMSRECDITRGLCCQIQRRHRQATRKVCSYFKDPLVCIGPVATDQIKSIVQYTSGEKRITQGQHNRNLLYKRGLFL